MASIAKRADGSWRARYRDAHGTERSRHFDRRIDAQAWLDAVTTEVQTGTYVDRAKGKITVGEWSKRWLSGQAHLKPSTYERYAGIVRAQIEPRWRDVSLACRTRTCRPGSRRWLSADPPRLRARCTACSR